MAKFCTTMTLFFGAMLFLGISSMGSAADKNVLYPKSGHADLECADCHGSKEYSKIDYKSYGLCERCHEEIVDEVKNSPHKGLGATCPDTGPVTCLMCHNPHQGILKEGKWEDQILAAYNKFAFKFKKVTGTEHTWRAFKDTNAFCLDCHGAGDAGKPTDLSKIDGSLGVGKIVGYKPYPDVHGMGDETGSLPMDSPGFIGYTVWKLERAYWGIGKAKYGSRNYKDALENCSNACHDGGYLYTEKKYVGPSGYHCNTCHPSSAKEAETRVKHFKSTASKQCTDCHMISGSHSFKAHQ